jgi:hypothetical protein
MTMSIDVSWDGAAAPRNRGGCARRCANRQYNRAFAAQIPETTMKKIAVLFAVAVLYATQASAVYIVVLKSGAKYEAKAKWTVVDGKAIVQLTNGQSLQLDPTLIDVAKSEHATKMGLGNANVLDLNPAATQQASAPKQPTLGDQIRLRRQNTPQATTPTPVPVPATTAAAGSLPNLVIDKFDRAFENVGIFEKKVTSNGARTLRAELTVDTEERVFNAISATSFLMVRNAGENVQIDLVELFMKTTNGGAAGRFQMTRADAEALDKRTLSQQDYFLRKVIY